MSAIQTVAASYVVVVNNVLAHNVGIGVSLEGTLSRFNVVQNNEIFGTQGTDAAVSEYYRTRENREPFNEFVVGTGVYIQQGTDNVIGAFRGGGGSRGGALGSAVSALLSRRSISVPTPGNRIAGSGAAGVYLFNQAVRNSVRQNTISDAPRGMGRVVGCGATMAFWFTTRPGTSLTLSARGRTPTGRRRRARLPGSVSSRGL